MRVLFLVDALFADAPGGSRLAAEELARHLVLRGHAVTALAPALTSGQPWREQRHGVEFYRYPRHGAGLHRAVGLLLGGRRALGCLLATSRYDLIHVHFAYASLPLLTLPRTTRPPTIRTFYGPWAEEALLEERRDRQPRGAVRARWAARRLVEATSLRRSARIIVLSQYSLRQVIGEYGIEPGRVQVVAGAVDVARFHPSAEPTAMRARLGLPADRPILLTIRRLAARMGLDALLHALVTVVASHPRVLLVVGGSGALAPDLKRLVARLGLGHHVRFVGHIPDEQLPSYYQAADVFVLPSQALEGFGLVILEALASGLPVLGTPVGAIPEILRQAEPSWILPGRDPAALAHGIKRFLDGSLCPTISPGVLRERVLTQYTWPVVAEQTERVYGEVIRKPT